jgi:hypothetical protein
LLSLVIFSILTFLMGIIALEDFQFRHIRIIWLTSMACIVIVWKLLTKFAIDWLLDCLINFLLVFLYFLLVQLYYAVKTKKWELMFNKAIGFGDVFFIIILSLWLNPVELIFLLPLSLTFALMGHFFLQNDTANIPLAGWMAMFFTSWGWVCEVFEIDLKVLLLNTLF